MSRTNPTLAEQPLGPRLSRNPRLSRPQSAARLLAGVVALLLFVLAAGPAGGQVGPPAPTEEFLSWFEVDQPPSVPFDAYHMVFDFEPGATAQPHTHGGPAFITMLQGELTVAENGIARTYRAGDTLVELPEHVYSAVNAGSTTSRLMVTYLIPVGAALTTVEDAEHADGSARGPTVVYESVLNVAEAPSEYDVVHRVLSFAPGAWSPPHQHGGWELGTVVQGELSVRRAGFDERVAVGGQYIREAGEVHETWNAGDVPVVVVATYLLPRGAELTTALPAKPAALPLPHTPSL